MKRTQTAVFGAPEYDPKRVGSYRPRIEPDQLRRLWLLKQQVGKAITKLVKEAIDLYLVTQERR